jgi:copper transporter 1
MSMNFAAGLGPTLWFAGWAPSSAGSTFAACLGLFLLAAFSRLLHAVVGTLHVSRLQPSGRHFRLGTREKDDDEALESARSSTPPRKRLIPPFTLSVDLGRGVLAFFTWGIGYFLMLAVVRLSTSIRLLHG